MKLAILILIIATLFLTGCTPTNCTELPPGSAMQVSSELTIHHNNQVWSFNDENKWWFTPIPSVLVSSVDDCIVYKPYEGLLINDCSAPLKICK